MSLIFHPSECPRKKALKGWVAVVTSNHSCYTRHLLPVDQFIQPFLLFGMFFVNMHFAQIGSTLPQLVILSEQERCAAHVTLGKTDAMIEILTARRGNGRGNHAVGAHRATHAGTSTLLEFHQLRDGHREGVGSELCFRDGTVSLRKHREGEHGDRHKGEEHLFDGTHF